MTVTTILALIAAAIGLALGVLGAVNPAGAGRIVRLEPEKDPSRPEGRSELRANYGGIFFTVHAFALWALWTGHPHAATVAFTVGLMWMGIGLMRWFSILMEGVATRYNILGACFELAMGVVLTAPIWTGGPLASAASAG